VSHVYHLIDPANDDGCDPYSPPSLGRDGFIHATRERARLIGVAERFFHGRDRLDVWIIDVDRVDVPIIDEPAADDDGALYPHIRGPLDRRAIIGRASLVRTPDGTWQWRDTDDGSMR